MRVRGLRREAKDKYELQVGGTRACATRVSPASSQQRWHLRRVMRAVIHLKERVMVLRGLLESARHAHAIAPRFEHYGACRHVGGGDDVAPFVGMKRKANRGVVVCQQWWGWIRERGLGFGEGSKQAGNGRLHQRTNATEIAVILFGGRAFSELSRLGPSFFPQRTPLLLGFVQPVHLEDQRSLFA